MVDHSVFYVDHLITASTLESVSEINRALPSSQIPSKQDGVISVISSSHISNGVSSHEVCTSKKVDASDAEGGELVECRICQEEEEDGNMEAPCACSGSLKYAHRKCVQRWCNEKGDTTCEICHQLYKSGYTAPQPTHSDGSPIDISGSWGAHMDIRNPHLLAVAAAERHFLDAEYDEYAAANASGVACCRSAALILLALLLLRHALTIASAGGDEDASTFFTLFFLRAAGFLLPCYIMARAMNTLQRRRQRQEAVIAAAEVAFLLQAGQARGLRLAAVASGSSPGH